MGQDNWPKNLEAERILIGGLLGDPSAFDVVSITAKAFYRPAHAAIYQAAKDLHDVEGPVDPDALAVALGTKLEELGGFGVLADCAAAACDPRSIEHYAEVVEGEAIRRERMRAAYHLQEAIRGGDAGAEAEAQGRMFRALDGSDAGPISPRPELHESYMSFFGSNGQAVATPLADLDAKTGGLPLGEHVVIGGRPGSGKTALATFLVVRAAMDGVPSLYISLEQDRNELRARMMAQLAYLLGWKDPGVEHEALHRQTANRADVELLSSQIRDLPIWIEDRSIESGRLLRAAKTHIQRRGVKLLVLDHAQKVRDSSIRGKDSERLTIQALSSWWCAMAKRHHVVALLLSQLSRGPEQSMQVRRPRLSDLKASGDLEQDADKVLFMHLEHTEAKWGEVIIGKDRTGHAGGRRFKYGRNEKYLAFENWSDREDIYERARRQGETDREQRGGA